MMHGDQRTKDEREREETPPVVEDPVPAEPRGFATLRPEKRRLISSKGGRAAHQKGSAHQFTSEEAREAGKKGGLASARSRSKKSGA